MGFPAYNPAYNPTITGYQVDGQGSISISKIKDFWGHFDHVGGSGQPFPRWFRLPGPELQILIHICVCSYIYIYTYFVFVCLFNLIGSPGWGKLGFP